MRLIRLLMSASSCAAAIASAIAVPSSQPLPVAVAALNEDSFRRTLSADGRWLATDSLVSSDTWRARIRDLDTGRIVPLGDSQFNSWAPVWSGDGRKLAYFSNEGGSAALWVRDSSGNARQIEGVSGVPVGPWSHGVAAAWLPDGERLLALLAPRDQTTPEGGFGLRSVPFTDVAADQATVTIYGAEGSASGLKMPPKACGEFYGQCDLKLIDIRNGSISLIAAGVTAIPGVRNFHLSPDGEYVAYANRTEGRNAARDTPYLQHLYELTLCEVATGKCRSGASGAIILNSLKWSPDSRAIAYQISPGPGAVNGTISVLSIASANATWGEELPLFAADDFLGDTAAELWWDTDSQHLYALALNGSLWEVDGSSGDARVVGDIPGRRISKVLLKTLPSGVDRKIWVVAGGDRFAPALYRIDLANRRSRRLKGAPPFGSLVDIAEAANEVVFMAQPDARYRAELWRLDRKTGQVRSTVSPDPRRDYAMGEARVLRWRNADGTDGAGALLLPPGYPPERRLPMLVWVYGDDKGSTKVDQYAFGWKGGVFDFQVLATRGYAVLYPDTPTRVGSPMMDIFAAVNAGVDAAIAQGYADPKRLAIMGCSYGSNSALSVITLTTRFKAAELTCSTTHPDALAHYLLGPPDVDPIAIGDYFEKGQGKMGATPWQYPDRYLKNSPIFGFDRIQTPILIGKGELDTDDRIASDAIFRALRRLGKPVEYRIYRGEGHAIMKPANVIDFWNRRLAFLAQHLDLAIDDTGVVIFDGDRVRSR